MQHLDPAARPGAAPAECVGAYVYDHRGLRVRVCDHHRQLSGHGNMTLTAPAKVCMHACKLDCCLMVDEIWNLKISRFFISFLLFVFGRQLLSEGGKLFTERTSSMSSNMQNGAKRGSRKRVSQVESNDAAAPPAKTARTEPSAKPCVADIFETLEYGPAPESASVASKWLDEHDRALGHFIDGKWYKPAGRSTYDSVNQATGEKLATTLQGTADDVNVAVTAARKAYANWNTLSGTKCRKQISCGS